jgi:hypothetical protein
MLNIKERMQKKIDNGNFRLQKGVSLYFALAIMAILLAIGFGLSTIIVSQTKMTKEVGDSLISLQAADTGIERAMYALYKEKIPPPFNFSGYLDLNQNGQQDSKEPTYQVTGLSPVSDCSAQYYCLRSIGNFKGIKRAVDASY